MHIPQRMPPPAPTLKPAASADPPSSPLQTPVASSAPTPEDWKAADMGGFFAEESSMWEVSEGRRLHVRTVTLSSVPASDSVPPTESPAAASIPASPSREVQHQHVRPPDHSPFQTPLKFRGGERNANLAPESDDGGSRDMGGEANADDGSSEGGGGGGEFGGIFSPLLSPVRSILGALSPRGRGGDGADAAAGEVPPRAEILFVHGSCGASGQFDRLLAALRRRIREEGKEEEEEEEADHQAGAGAVVCHLFDALGCGGSRDRPSDDGRNGSPPSAAVDPSAFGSEEALRDLEGVVRAILTGAGKGEVAGGEDGNGGRAHPPLYLVGHSYGASQIVRLLASLAPDLSGRIGGAVLLSGALAGGPSGLAGTGWGGTRRAPRPCVFCLPVPVLKILRPRLDDAFLSRAYHPTAATDLTEEGRKVCEGNDMEYAKAFYGSWEWATEEEAGAVGVPALVVHGRDDQIIEAAAGEHLAAALPRCSGITIVDGASHQVMEERPDEVAGVLVGLLAAGAKDA